MDTVLRALADHFSQKKEDVKFTVEIMEKKREDKNKVTLLLRGKIVNDRESDVDVHIEVVTGPQAPKSRKEEMVSNMKDRKKKQGRGIVQV